MLTDRREVSRTGTVGGMDVGVSTRRRTFRCGRGVLRTARGAGSGVRSAHQVYAALRCRSVFDYTTIVATPLADAYYGDAPALVPPLTVANRLSLSGPLSTTSAVVCVTDS